MQVIRGQERGNVTGRLPHGTLWSRGLALAEAEIGRGPAPSGRWARATAPAGTAGAGNPGAPGPRLAAWTREPAPADRAEGTIEAETWAAQAA